MLQAELRGGRCPKPATHGPAVEPRFRESEGGGIVAEFAIRLRAGMRKVVPLGVLSAYACDAS